MSRNNTPNNIEQKNSKRKLDEVAKENFKFTPASLEEDKKFKEKLNKEIE